MARDEPHDAIRGSVGARELGAAPGVIEISRERRSAAGQPGADPRGEAREEHTRDAVPEARGRRLRAIVEETRDDDLVIGAEPAQDPRRFGRVPVVSSRRGGCLWSASGSYTSTFPWKTWTSVLSPPPTRSPNSVPRSTTSRAGVPMVNPSAWGGTVALSRPSVQ